MPGDRRTDLDSHEPAEMTGGMLSGPASAAKARRHSDQNRTIGRGVSWTALSTVVAKSIGVLAKLALAWFLVPRDFGLVSMVIVFIQIVKGIADLGLRPALIGRQRDGDTRLLFDAAFWALLIIGGAIFAVMALVGVPFMIWFYGEPGLASVAVAMCLAIPLQNAQLVPEAILYRLQRFKAIALCEISGAVVGSSFAVAMAFAGGGVWSLVAQTVVGTACTLVCYSAAAPWRPRWRLSWRVLAKVREYSLFILGARLMVYVQQNADYLLLGKLRGATDLGLYAFAFLLTETLRSQVFWIISRVVFPVYSRILNDKVRIAEIYLGTIRYMTLTMWPLSILLLLFSGPAITTFFGPKWSGATQPIQYLALASMIVASAGTSGEVFRALGKPQIDFSINARVTLFVALPALWTGTSLMGPTGTAIAVVVYGVAARIVTHRALTRELGTTLRDVLRVMLPALTGITAMLAASLLLRSAHWVIAAAVATAVYVLVVTPTLVPYYRVFRRSRAASGFEDKGGLTITFLGPDGAGKSSLVDLLGQRRSARCMYMGMSGEAEWKFGPAQAVYRRQGPRRNRIVRALSGGLFWYILFPIEIIMRRRAARSEPQRDWLLLDRVPGPPFLRRGLLGRYYQLLLPRSDVVVLLQGDPDIISARKPDETSPERTRREMIKWAIVARRLSAHVIELDTTKLTIEQCATIVEQRLAGDVGS